MKPQVIELHQPMSPAMHEIQTAIIESMDATLAEIRRCNTNLEVDDLTIDNALHRSFDQIIRNQLNPIWHRVSFKTKQLVTDLKTLRQLLSSAQQSPIYCHPCCSVALKRARCLTRDLLAFSYLLAFDCITFYRFLNTILVANSPKESVAGLRHNESPWLFISAADTIFSVVKNRVYSKQNPSTATDSNAISILPGDPT